MIQLDSPPKTLAINSTKTLVVPITSHVSPWLLSLLYPVARRLVLPFHFGRIEVKGQENIPKTGPVILAPTHRSRWDAIVVPALTGQPISGRNPRFMVSVNEMQGLQGWFIRRAGGFPVDPKQPGIGTIRHSVELLRNGEMLVMFPEGNIFREGTVQPLKLGMARIALQVEASQPGIGVKIVPIGIRYSQPYPSWGCDIRFEIGTPLNVMDYYNSHGKKGAQPLTSDLEVALR